MIWFPCTKCGNAISRPDASAGAYIFCVCGQGNVVPWESTMAVPPGPSPEEVPPAPPVLRPVPVGEEQIPVVRRPPPAWEDERGTRSREAQAFRDPAKCFNHQDRPGQEKCGDCSETFCSDCLLKFKGNPLCGPCKNVRLRNTAKSATVSGKAVVGVIVALCCAPVTMCLWPVGLNAISIVVGGISLLAAVAAAALGCLALRDTEKDPRLAGRPLAITTILTAGLAVVLTSCFLLMGPR